MNDSIVSQARPFRRPRSRRKHLTPEDFAQLEKHLDAMYLVKFQSPRSGDHVTTGHVQSVLDILDNTRAPLIDRALRVMRAVESLRFLIEEERENSR